MRSIPCNLTNAPKPRQQGFTPESHFFGLDTYSA